MLTLILRVVAHAEDSEPASVYARFGADGGLIGRADSARLCLPDPKRTVSRFHAHVSWSDGTFFVEDMGSTNAASVNGVRLTAGQKQELRPGDKLRIGDYTLAVEFEDPEFARTQVLGEGGLPAPAAGDDGDERTRLAVRGSGTHGVGTAGQPTHDELWRAFCDGARVEIDLPQGLRPEMMRIIGLMLSGSVGGLRRLLQLRAAAKREVEAEVTTIRTRNNNPLKFATDDARALTALLKPPMHSFMSGPAAIDDSVDDLESHALASATALRIAIERTLARFDPEALEARLSGGGVLDSLVPMSRKARLWELYLEQQRAIRHEAEESFEDVFTRAFAEAYEREVARLKQARG
jgi:predicted component of type VI protein secretion system